MCCCWLHQCSETSLPSVAGGGGGGGCVGGAGSKRRAPEAGFGDTPTKARARLLSDSDSDEWN